MNNFFKPFLSTFSSLNGGIITLYEIFNKDNVAELKDLKLFLLLLDVYGTGKAVSDSGKVDSI